jgi:chromosome partitioning protein
MQAKDGGVSDADNFRTRATEIFRQLRTNGERPETTGDDSSQDDTTDQVSSPGPTSTEPDRSGPEPESAATRRTDEGRDEPDDQAGADRGSDHLGLPDAASLDIGGLPDSGDLDRWIPGADRSDAARAGRPPIRGSSETAPAAATAPGATVSTGATVTSGGTLATDDLLRADPLADIDLGDEHDPPSDERRHPGSRRPLPRVLAIANQKGGVGKTTTAVNLGAALAELGYRVLVTDLDPQGNATTGLGINGRNLDASIYDVLLHDTPIEDVIEPTTLRNLFVVPATIDLAGAEIELVPVFSRELRLRRAIDSVRDEFDFVLIDCPPSLGLLTVNGLAAATEVVVPIQCEYYALEGLGQLLRNVNLVQGNLNQGLELSTIILTMYDARTRLAEQVVNDVRKHFGARVCRSVVPRTVRLSEAPSFGQPIIVFDSSSRGAIAYRELAKEVSGGAPQRIR